MVGNVKTVQMQRSFDKEQSLYKVHAEHRTFPKYLIFKYFRTRKLT